MITVLKRVPKSIFLLISIVSFVFILPLLKYPRLTELFNAIAYSFMLLSVFSIIDKKTRFLKYMVVAASFLIWLMYFSSSQASSYVAFLFSVVVFTITTVVMVMQIVSSKTVTGKVIVETICGYLLIGVIFGFLNSVLLWINPGSIGIDGPKTMADIMYYSFITITTIGFGDISPVSPGAKSLSILFGVISQLYLTIIMALIIGKFLNSKSA